MAIQASSLVMVAGGLAFIGSFKQAGGFPSNGYAIVGGTVALTFITSLTNGSTIDPAVRGLAGLMLLAAVYAYVPGLTKKSTPTKKDKSHG